MKSEQLQKLAITAEIVGAVAVVVTLIILIVEVRENTAASKRNSMLNVTTEPLAIFLNNPDVQAVVTRAREIDGGNSALLNRFKEVYGFDDAESDLFARYLGYVWRIRESEFLYGESDTESFRENIKFFLQNPGNRLYWEEGSAPYDAEFHSLIVELISEIDSQ